MQLEHPDLTAFEPILKQCHEQAHTSGLQALHAAGRRLEEIKTTRGTHRRFIRGGHYGFDLAQRHIGRHVLEIEEHIITLEANLKMLRSGRKSEAPAVVEQIKVLRNRQLVLRRLVDSILYSILSVTDDHWAMKHLSIESRVKRVDPITLPKIIDAAIARNKSDRMIFHLVCDLTTGAQIGDLIQIDRSSPGKAPWQVLELKSGKINVILDQIIDAGDGTLSESELREIQEKLGKHAPKQATRMLRQRTRQAELERMVRDDVGVSPQFEKEVVFIDLRQTVHLDSITGAVVSACEALRKDGVGVSIVDDCLHVIALESEKIGDDDRSVAHCQ
jgi:hypothetical protein